MSVPVNEAGQRLHLRLWHLVCLVYTIHALFGSTLFFTVYQECGAGLPANRVALVPPSQVGQAGPGQRLERLLGCVRCKHDRVAAAVGDVEAAVTPQQPPNHHLWHGHALSSIASCILCQEPQPCTGPVQQALAARPLAASRRCRHHRHTQKRARLKTCVTDSGAAYNTQYMHRSSHPSPLCPG